MSALVGTPVQVATQSSREGNQAVGGMATVVFQDATRTTSVMLGVVLGGRDSRPFQIFLQRIVRGGQPVSGLGDEAIFTYGMLFVRRGDIYLAVLAANRRERDSAQRLAVERRIAELALSRLGD